MLTAPIAVEFVLALPLSSALASTAGSVDTTFGTYGVATVSVGTWASATSVAVQPDGQIVTAGEATIDGSTVVVSTRMASDGSLDPTYGTGGVTAVDLGAGSAVGCTTAIALQPDGKIVIAGCGRNSSSGSLAFAAIRLNTDGTPDASFGDGGDVTLPIGTAATADAVAIQPDGKIVLGGTAQVGQDELAVARLNPDGSVDTSFGTEGATTFGPEAEASGMVLQPDGQIVLSGHAAHGPSAQQFIAARLDADGTVDSSFGTGGITEVPIGSTALSSGIAQQSDGKLVLAGSALTTTTVAATVRLDTNGSLDPTYGTGGISTVADANGVNGIVIDPTGDIVLPSIGPSVLRLTPSGSPDSTFGTDGVAEDPAGSPGTANGLAIQSDGDLVIAGSAAVNGQDVIAVSRLLVTAPSGPTAVVQIATSAVTSILDTGEAPLTGAVAPSPSNLARPLITGTAKEGSRLQVTEGTWANSPATFGYQWQDCDATATVCTSIAGANRSSYTLTPLDVGYSIRTVVRAGNGGGAAEAYSRQTALVRGTKSTAAPQLSQLHLAAQRFSSASGTTLTLRASEPARLSVRLTRRSKGHHAPRTDLTLQATTGRNQLAFKPTRLTPGAYAAAITARNVVGKVSRSYTVRFALARAPATQDDTGSNGDTSSAAAPCTDVNTPASSAVLAAMRVAVVCLVNQQRADRGLPPLVEQSQLERSAQSWTDWMVANNDFTHGTDFSGRLAAVGYDWQDAGENIGTGYETPSTVVQAWMASPDHCRNILDPNYVSVGTGMNPSPVPSTASAGATWTQDFGLLMSQNPPSTNEGPANGCPY